MAPNILKRFVGKDATVNTKACSFFGWCLSITNPQICKGAYIFSKVWDSFRLPLMSFLRSEALLGLL